MKYLFYFIILLPLKVDSQNKINVNSIFKMCLYLDKESVHIKHNKQTNKLDSLIVKNDSLYESFNEVVSLDIKPLDTKGFGKRYSFYSLKVFDKENGFTKSIKYNRNVNNIETDLFFIGPGNFDNYQFVIVIDNFSGRSYRIIGFLNSDFLNFLYDFQNNSIDKLNKKVSIKTFLKKYFVEGVDFICLYEGLRNGRNFSKYPCLKPCNQPISNY